MSRTTERMEKYFRDIEKEVATTYKHATEARKKGLDPEPVVDISLTKNMAQRVEGLISTVAPKLKNSGMTKRIAELEKKYGSLAWEVALLIAEDVAKEKFCKFETKKEAMEVGIRVGFAYHTLGIVAAPLEGFIELNIKKRRDGKEYFAVKYAGPIRGAGGTGASVSVLIADYVRKRMGYEAYDPTEQEIGRFCTELTDYHERVTNLQYKPSDEELTFLIKNVPVEVDGDPTEDIDVSNYKDLSRVETNRIRSGVCLVVSMLALKAPKMWKRIQKMNSFELDWNFIPDFLAIQKQKKSHSEKKDTKQKTISPDYTFISDLVAGRPVLTHPLANGGFRLRYGRSRASGFSAAGMHPATMRLLYNYVAVGTQLKLERPGKAAAMIPCDTISGPIVLLDDGSVVAIETESEAKRLNPKVEEILFLGDILISYGDFSENNHFLVPPGYCEEWWALELEKAIVDTFGILDVEKAATLVNIPESHIRHILKNPQAKISALAAIEFSSKLGVPMHPCYTYFWRCITSEQLEIILEALMSANIIIEGNQITKMIITQQKKRDYKEGRQNTQNLSHVGETPNALNTSASNTFFKSRISQNNSLKCALENIGVPHILSPDGHIVLDRNNTLAILETFGIHDLFTQLTLSYATEKAEEVASSTNVAQAIPQNTQVSQQKESLGSIIDGSQTIQEQKIIQNIIQKILTPFISQIKETRTSDEIENATRLNDGKTVLEIINSKNTYPYVRDKAGTFIGSRMGRPEKAKMRKLAGSPHVLFPVGQEGGKMRSFQAALDAGMIKGEFPIYYCSKHDAETIYPVCDICNKKTKQRFNCSVCGTTDHDVCPKGGVVQKHVLQEIDISRYISSAKKLSGVQVIPDLVKGVRGVMNKDKIPENLAKGLLRAKHGVYVNKDGTIRYDMSELPLTHFKPKEIGTSIEKLRILGYTEDIYGKSLTDTNQVLELKPLDVVLSSPENTTDERADDVLFSSANFIDDMLINVYSLEPFYKFKTKEDLPGVLVIGLAPHISAGMMGRVIGFSKSQTCFAHPLWHAALRRDCDGDEACVFLLMDGLLNFSRQFLPDSRGGRTMDSPLVLSSRLDPAEVDDMVHGLDVVWKYPLEFYRAAQEMKYAYEVEIEQLKKRLGTPEQYEKIGFTHDVDSINSGVTCSAYKTLPSMQEKLKGQMDIAERIRAVNSSDVAARVIEKHFLKDTKGNLRKFSQQQFRCVNCNEKYRRPPLKGVCLKCKGKLLFTVSEGSVVKYLDLSLNLAEKYKLPDYIKQSLEILKRRIEGMFGKEKEKQVGLGKWF